MPHRHALPVLRLCCETVVWVWTGRCACNKRGASDEPGDSDGKNIDGVFTISLTLSGANMKQHFLAYFIYVLLPCQLEQASEKHSKRHWIHICHEPEKAATGPGAQTNQGSQPQFCLHCLSQG